MPKIELCIAAKLALTKTVTLIVQGEQAILQLFSAFSLGHGMPLLMFKQLPYNCL